jgi:hypothetical protein
MIELPSSKFTVPVGTGAPAAPETAMLKVTDCPKRLGLFEALSVIAVDALFTTCVMVAEEPPTKLLFPPNIACIECLPALKKLFVTAPVPEEFSAVVPRIELPSVNITDPERHPLPENIG